MTPPIEVLVRDCLDRLEESGGDLERALAPVASSHPDLLEAVRGRVEALDRAGLLTPSEPLLQGIPERIGEFELLRKLGGGGMGVVYLARQGNMRRLVALKLVRPGQALFQDGVFARFRREAEAAARLSHPNIVPVYTFGEEGGLPFLAMEYVRGSSLDRVLAHLASVRPKDLTGRSFLDAVLATDCGEGEDPPAPDAEFFGGTSVDVVLRIALGIARALAHAHARGVLQRDVKPSNVMLTADGRVLLLDFGLSSLTGSERVTKSGALVGSLPFMAPEQLRGESRAVDERTDVYGAGVTLYELLTRQSPFLDSASPERTRARVLAGRATAPRRIDASIPKDVESVCQVAMDSDPERRYESAHALCVDLQNLLARRPVQARPVGVWTHLLRFARRRPEAASAVALGALVVIGGPLAYTVQSVRAQHRLEREVDRADSNYSATLLALERADRHYQDSLDALELVTKVAIDDLEDVPMAEAGQRSVLKGVSAFYARMASEEEEGQGLDARRASALLQLGRAQEALGELEEAAASERQAIELLSTRGAERSEPESRDLARAHRHLGQILERQGDVAQALLEFDAARELLARSTLDEEAFIELARVEVDRIHAWRQTGEGERARKAIMALLEELETRPLEESPDAAELAAWCYGEVSVMDPRARLGMEQREALERALELNELLVRKDPTSRTRRQKLMIAQSNLAGLLVNTRSLDEAVLLLQDALASAEGLVADYPGIAAYRYNLVGVLTNAAAAQALGAGGDTRDAELDEAIALLERASSEVRRLLADDPDESDYLSHHLSVALNLVELRFARPLAESEVVALLDELDAVAPTLATLSRLRPTDNQIAGCRAFLVLQRLRANARLARPTAILEATRELSSIGSSDQLFAGAIELSKLCAVESVNPTELEALREAFLTLLELAVADGLDGAALATDERFAAFFDEPRFQALTE